MTLRYIYSNKEGFIPQNHEQPHSSSSTSLAAPRLPTQPNSSIKDIRIEKTNPEVLIHESRARPRSAGSYGRRPVSVNPNPATHPTYPLWHRPSSSSSNPHAVELDWNSSAVVKLRQRVKSFQQMFTSSDKVTSSSSRKQESAIMKSKLQAMDKALSDRISGILNWIRLREGYLAELQAMVDSLATIKPKKKDPSKDKFMILFQALRKITYRIVESYSALLADLNLQKISMVEDIRVYVANLVYSYALPAEPYHNWICIDCTSNPLLCHKKVDGVSAILKNSSNDILAPSLRFSDEEERKCERLQQFIWDTFVKYQDEKLASNTDNFIVKPPSSEHSVKRQNQRPSTAGAKVSFRQRFDNILRPQIPSQATETETEILTIDHYDDVTSDEEEGLSSHKSTLSTYQIKRCLLIWKKELFYWKRIRSFMRHRRRMIFRQVRSPIISD